jgi:hypothetical protein
MGHEAVAGEVANERSVNVPACFKGNIEGFCSKFFAEILEHFFIFVNIEGAGAID